MVKKNTANASLQKKKAPLYGQGNKFWKFFDIGEAYLVYATYSKGEALGIPTPQLSNLLIEQEPFIVASYKGKGTKFGHITSFKIENNPSVIALAAKKHRKTFEIIPVTKQQAQIDTDFNIEAVIREPISLLEHEKIKDLLRSDVSQHCKVPAITKKSIASHYSLVDKIISTPNFKHLPKKELFIKGKGGYESRCLLQWGFDLLSNCFATMLPDGRYAPKSRCTYCYAEHLNGKPATDGLKIISRADFRSELENKLQGKGPHFIRGGQRVENIVPSVMKSWNGFVDKLPLVLEEIARARQNGKDISVAFPTKIVEYDKHLADLMVAANVTLLGSIGYEQLEENVLRFGSTTEKRLDGLLAYAQAGVNAAPYVITDVTRGLKHVQNEAKVAMEFYENHKDVLAGLQFLDARITKKKDAPLIAGGHWDDIKDQQGQLNFYTTPRYHLTGNGHLAANFVHQDFLEVIGNNQGDIRMCYTHGPKDLQQCGRCFMK